MKVRGKFRYIMEKDWRKSYLKFIFQKNPQKCVKITKKEKSEHVCRLLRSRLWRQRRELSVAMVTQHTQITRWNMGSKRFTQEIENGEYRMRLILSKIYLYPILKNHSIGFDFRHPRLLWTARATKEAGCNQGLSWLARLLSISLNFHNDSHGLCVWFCLLVCLYSSFLLVKLFCSEKRRVAKNLRIF